MSDPNKIVSEWAQKVDIIPEPNVVIDLKDDKYSWLD